MSGGRAPRADCISTDLQSVLSHQIAHLIGLDHSSSSASSVFHGLPVGDTSLRPVDSGSLCFACQMYPRGQASPDCFDAP